MTNSTDKLELGLVQVARARTITRRLEAGARARTITRRLEAGARARTITRRLEAGARLGLLPGG